MNRPEPTCTVIIPCYNGEQELVRDVDSVRAQAFDDYQLVLVDDESTDNARSIMRQLAAANPKITFVELDENLGRARARNRGALVARGRFLAFLDHDDTYHPDFLMVTCGALEKSPRYDAIKVLPNLTVDVDPARYDAISNSMIPSMVMRRGAFEFIGGYPESSIFRDAVAGLEDVAFAKLFHSCFNTGIINAKLYNYILRPGNSLDRFLSRSRVVDGKLKFTPDAVRDDAEAFQELDRLLLLLRERIRNRIVEGGSRGLEKL